MNRTEEIKKRNMHYNPYDIANSKTSTVFWHDITYLLSELEKAQARAEAAEKERDDLKKTSILSACPICKNKNRKKCKYYAGEFADKIIESGDCGYEWRGPKEG